MENHQFAILGHADVGLESAETLFIAAPKGRQRIFLELVRAATVSKHKALFLRGKRTCQSEHPADDHDERNPLLNPHRKDLLLGSYS